MCTCDEDLPPGTLRLVRFHEATGERLEALPPAASSGALASGLGSTYPADPVCRLDGMTPHRRPQ